MAVLKDWGDWTPTGDPLDEVRGPAPRAGFIRLHSDEVKPAFKAEMISAPVPSGGGPIIEEKERPGQTSLVRVTGWTPRRITVKVAVDEWASGRSVEDECRALERMAEPVDGARTTPLLTVEGLVAHSFDRASHVRWRLQEPDWGDDEDVIWSSFGYRVRQLVTITLVQAVDSDPVVLSPALAKKRAKLSKGDLSKVGGTMVVREGDTPARIAKRAGMTGKDAGKEILRFNGQRDPKWLRRVVGKTIVLPT